MQLKRGLVRHADERDGRGEDTGDGGEGSDRGEAGENGDPGVDGMPPSERAQ